MGQILGMHVLHFSGLPIFLMVEIDLRWNLGGLASLKR